MRLAFHTVYLTRPTARHLRDGEKGFEVWAGQQTRRSLRRAKLPRVHHCVRDRLQAAGGYTRTACDGGRRVG